MMKATVGALAGTIAITFFAVGAWAFVPAQLVELDSFARPIVLKRFIEVSGVTGDNVFYGNFKTSVGKYSPERGDFRFSAEILVNETSGKKFQCELPFIEVQRDQVTGQLSVDERALRTRVRCKEVTPH